MHHFKFIVIVALSLLMISLCSCSGENKPANLAEGFLNYPAVETVQFSIQGQATCNKCNDYNLPIIGFQLEVVPKDDPMKSLGLYSFDQLGAFTISGLNAASGSTLQFFGTLFMEGTDEPVTLHGYSEIAAPEGDGDIVAIVLSFPSSEGN